MCHCACSVALTPCLWSSGVSESSVGHPPPNFYGQHSATENGGMGAGDRNSSLGLGEKTRGKARRVE